MGGHVAEDLDLVLEEFLEHFGFYTGHLYHLYGYLLACVDVVASICGAEVPFSQQVLIVKNIVLDLLGC